MKQHISVVHRKEKNYQCNQCQARFSYKLSLNGHIKSVHNPQIKDFKCDECDYGTQIKGRLTKHKQVRHSERVRKYECKPCEKSYLTRDGVRVTNITFMSDVRMDRR